MWPPRLYLLMPELPEVSPVDVAVCDKNVSSAGRRCSIKILKRCMATALAISNLYWIALLGLLAAIFIDHTDAGIENNPVANPPVITPVVWVFVVILAVSSPFTLAMLFHGCMSDCRRRGRSRRQRMCCVLGHTGGFCAGAFPLLGFIVIAFTKGGAFACVQGFHSFRKGAYCICDPRTLITAGGMPKYVPGGMTPQNLTVAFVGDMDEDDVEQVYDLIRKEGSVSAVVLNGDLDYAQDHHAWVARFESSLGNVPFYVTVGNHDTWTWRDYQEKTKEHYVFSNVTECSGTIGVREVCTHKGLGLLLSGAGSGCGGLHPEHTPFFEETLQQFVEQKVTWRICLFHKNQRKMQLGSKKDAVGWDKYELCLKHGAMIFTSHEHTYGRTHEVDHLSENSVRVSRQVPKGSSAENAIQVGGGRSFVVVNGLGGGSVRGLAEERVSDPWWAASWGGGRILQDVAGFGPGAPEASFGVFFCTFHVNGDPQLARCYMKDVLGRLVDEFYVRSVV